MTGDYDTPDEKRAKGSNGGAVRKNRGEIDLIWDEVQAANRAAGPWGALERIGRAQEPA